MAIYPFNTLINRLPLYE